MVYLRVAGVWLFSAGLLLAASRERVASPEWIVTLPQFAAFGLVEDHHERVVIGGQGPTNSSLYVYTRNGKRVGEASTAAYAAALNVNRRGQVAVTGRSALEFGPPIASFTTRLFSQRLRALQWEATLVPTNDYHTSHAPYFYYGEARAIVLDEEGRAFIAGTSRKTPTDGVRGVFAMAQEGGSTVWFSDRSTGLDDSLAGMVLTRGGDVITAVNQRFSGESLKFYYERHTREGELVWRTNSNFAVNFVSLAGLALDSQENLIAAGRYEKFGPVYDEGYFVEKRDAAGVLVWRVFISIQDFTAATALAVDRKDNVYVNYLTHSSRGWSTAKLNSTGELQWTATKMNVLAHMLDRVAVDEDENVYVSASVIAPAPSRQGDIETRMLNRDGETEWEAFYDAGADERLVDLVTDDKGLYVTFQSSAGSFAPPKAITSFVVRYSAKARKGN